MRIIIKPLGLAVLLIVIGILVMVLRARSVNNSELAAASSPAPLPSAAAIAASRADVPASSVTEIIKSGGTVSALFDENGGAIPSIAGNTGLVGRIMGGATWVPGIAGSALHFDRARRQFVDFGAPSVDTSHSFTVSCWVRMDDTNGYQTFVSQDGSNISAFYLQKSDIDGKFSLTVHSDDSASGADPVVGGAGFRATSRQPAVAGAWYHLAGEYDREHNTTRLYVNGALEGSLPLPTTVHLWKSDGHTIAGAAKWSGNRVDYVNGAIDNVRIYPRALDAAQIKDLYDHKM